MTGYALGTRTSTRVLISREGELNSKEQPGRKEWAIVIGCIRATGLALPPPLVISKASNANPGWIPPEIPKDWSLLTTTSGWTNDDVAFEWLKIHFEPLTH